MLSSSAGQMGRLQTFSAVCVCVCVHVAVLTAIETHTAELHGISIGHALKILKFSSCSECFQWYLLIS